MKKYYIKSIAVLTVFAMVTAPFMSHAFSLGLGKNKVKVNAEARAEARLENDEDHEEWSYEEVEENENLPKGIRHAPGIKKRLDDGKGLPWGIFKNFWNRNHDDDNDSDDEDVVEIDIDNLEVTTTSDGATVSFETNVMTSGTLTYSTDSDLDGGVVVNLSLNDEHSVDLEDLESDTKYYYSIDLEDEGDLTYEGDIHSFTTEEVDDEAPSISMLNVFAVSEDSAYVIWFTTEDSDSKVWIGTDSDVDTEVGANYFEEDLVNLHIVHLTNLEADTTYYFKVSSSDSSDNEDLSETESFTTDAS